MGMRLLVVAQGSRLFGVPGQLASEVLEALREHADEIADTLYAEVSKNTKERAYDTGALLESVERKPNTGKYTLARVWFNDAPQIETWGRVYAAYQEGPPYGLSTYTNEPRHMLRDAEQQTAQVESWGKQAVDEHLDIWTGVDVMVVG
jgi:hypothetical protein